MFVHHGSRAAWEHQYGLSGSALNTREAQMCVCACVCPEGLQSVEADMIYLDRSDALACDLMLWR